MQSISFTRGSPGVSPEMTSETFIVITLFDQLTHAYKISSIEYMCFFF